MRRSMGIAAACFFSLSLRGGEEGYRLWTEPESGEPGEEIAVVIKGQWIELLEAVTIHIVYDPAKLTYLYADFSSGVGALGALTGVRRGRSGRSVAVVARADPQRGYALPPSQAQEIARLFFRIRSGAPPGDAQAEIVERSDDWPSKTVFSVLEQFTVAGRLYEHRSSAYPCIENSPVIIERSSGLLPPDLFTCAGELDRVSIRWKNPTSYDSLILRRNGRQLAVLPGSAVSFEDVMVPAGQYQYSLVGRQGAALSIEVRCGITVTEPHAEAVEELACRSVAEGVELTWSLPRSYDRIEIRRNGEVIEILAGHRTHYHDSTGPEGATLYEVIGYVGDISGLPARCVVGTEWTIRIGSAVVSPGGKGYVPVYFTHLAAIKGFSFGLRFDPSALSITGLSTEGTLLEGRALLRFQQRPSEPGETGFGFIFADPFLWTMPAAVEACYMKLIVEVSPSAPRGRVLSLELTSDAGTPPVDVTFADTSAECVWPRALNGEVVIGTPEVPGVVDLQAEPLKGTNAFRLNWRNAAQYDRVQIERNGILREVLGPAARSFADEVPGPGIYWYRVRGIQRGIASPWRVLVQNVMSGEGVFARGDVNGDRRVNLADILVLCRSLFLGAALDCDDAADANDDGTVDFNDPLYLLSFLFASTAPPPSPGPWGSWYDPTYDELDCRRTAR